MIVTQVDTIQPYLWSTHSSCGTTYDDSLPSERLPDRVHLIGIGGSGMRSLASVLCGARCRVTGSDVDIESLSELFNTTLLGNAPKSTTARVHQGHAAEHLPADCQCVVYSDAITPDNPELREARRRHVPCLSYPQMLARLMQGRTGIAIAGTHGKSTTTAMVARILETAGVDPTVIIGAVPVNHETSGHATGGRAGHGPHVLVEACEYRGNFLQLLPQAGVILNVEADHFDCFADEHAVTQAFAQFCDRVDWSGPLLVSADNHCASRLRQHAARRPFLTFGLQHGADWQVSSLVWHEAGCATIDIRRARRSWGRIRLQVPGWHNVANALAAAALSSELGIASDAICEGLSSFAGLRRRIEDLGTRRGISLYDDYAHHPTAVTATLGTLRRMHPGRRLCCIFQPHQLSRTSRLLDALAVSLQNADRVMVLPVFAARENITAREHALAGARGTDNNSANPSSASSDPREALANRLARRVQSATTTVDAYRDADAAVAHWLHELHEGDVLVTIGAGDIGKMRNAIIDRL